MKTLIKLNENEDGRLEITGEMAKVLGPSLTTAAKQKRANVLANSALACTEDFYRQIEVLQDRIKIDQNRIKQIRERLEDIENGNWTLNNQGQIMFPHLPPPHIG